MRHFSIIRVTYEFIVISVEKARLVLSFRPSLRDERGSQIEQSDWCFWFFESKKTLPLLDGQNVLFLFQRPTNYNLSNMHHGIRSVDFIIM